jgi:hypothetical protein
MHTTSLPTELVMEAITGKGSDKGVGLEMKRSWYHHVDDGKQAFEFYSRCFSAVTTINFLAHCG